MDDMFVHCLPTPSDYGGSLLDQFIDSVGVGWPQRTDRKSMAYIERAQLLQEVESAHPLLACSLCVGLPAHFSQCCRNHLDANELTGR